MAPTENGKEIALLVKDQTYLSKGKDYDQAELAKDRALELCETDYQQRRETLEEQHTLEIGSMTDACAKEVDSFNEVWDLKDEEFEARVVEATRLFEEQVRKQHNAYLREIRDTTTPKEPHWSSECHRLMRLHKTLGDQRRFAEASEAKAKAENLQKVETEEWRTAREAKIKVYEDQFLAKRQCEFNAHLTRIHKAREDHERTRQAELKFLLRRHGCVKAQLETDHNKATVNEEVRYLREKVVVTPSVSRPLPAQKTKEAPHLSPYMSGSLDMEKTIAKNKFDVFPSELSAPNAGKQRG